MKPEWQIIHGDCRAELAKLEPKSVHMCVTSPPYHGLRDYGLKGTWWGLSRDTCSFHVEDWGSPTCPRCDSWFGVLGLEPSIEQYCRNIVECFRAVKRVLRDDGTLWLNLGDAYASSPPGNKTKGVSGASTLHGVESVRYRETLEAGHAQKRDTVRSSGLKAKNLIGQPWRVAFALQADGWYLRSDIIWHKPNPMPESVTDRPTRAHEYLFLLTLKPKYFYDAEAVREPQKVEHLSRYAYPMNVGPKEQAGGGRLDGASNTPGMKQPNPAGRNKRSVWTIPTEANPEAHFASFPRKLVLPCVLAGTSERGACPECGSPWLRVLEKDRQPTRPARDNKQDITGMANRDHERHVTDVKTLGWRAGCECETLACLKCCTVLEYGHGKDELGQLSRDVLAVRQELSRMATDNEVVQSGVSGSMGSQESANDEGVLQDGQRLRSGVSSRASTGGDKRDDNAAPSGYGNPPRETSEPGRNRASCKRQTGRQSNREPVADEKGTARSSTEGAETCVRCGSQLVTVPHNPVPATVLDPFVGSGTAGIVARQQGRNFIGIDASPEYCEMARQRIANPEPEPEVPDVAGQMTFEEVTA